MCICDASYPRKLAFSYLDELSKEFQRSYEGKIEGATRPYAFMGFGKSFPSVFDRTNQQSTLPPIPYLLQFVFQLRNQNNHRHVE